MTAVYGWSTGRHGAKDAFRMGHYSVLGYIARDIGLTFFYSGARSLLAPMQLNHGHGAPKSGLSP
ncbi:MAG TPA: hypothetical protein VNW97_12965 [Candidatus Saccharimonadales bacterium]|nr:hypothetical protein [Candidatus Saccharimonadales bacterium]